MVKAKILIIHNKYLNYSGEEAVVESQINLLREAGHQVISYFRESAEIEQMAYGKIKSFFLALYNHKSIKEIGNLIENESPDIVHIHNLYPLISPAFLTMIKNRGIPIVMTVHNYRLLCPNGLFLTKKEICEKCTSGIKELNCVINNCEGSVIKSFGYAIRNFWARQKKQYLDNVDEFLCLSNFQNLKLIENGFPKEKCHVIPNMINKEYVQDSKYKTGSFVGYVGRISSEKGSDIILEIAKELPKVMFKIAGNIDENTSMPDIPKNVELVGFLEPKELSEFYSNCIFTLFTSVWNETFGLSIIEAYAHKKPVISTNLGASTEIIQDNITGLIYHSKHDLIKKIELLISNTEKVKLMGQNAYTRLLEHYTPEVYYNSILKIYQGLIMKNKVAIKN